MPREAMSKAEDTGIWKRGSTCTLHKLRCLRPAELPNGDRYWRWNVGTPIAIDSGA